jgi:hypothetical protein
MTNLRKLVGFSFFGGMLFDSFISASVKGETGNATFWIILSAVELWIVLKVYDRVKGNK